MEKKQFKSESKRLLDLMINSIYTHKEIFLRELISNASDAIDKLCFIALTDDKLGMTRSDFLIELRADKDSRTLTITDNGIGMDRDDLENNLGTIASSGSYKFKQELENKSDDIDIIGQFGVGFYSAFMVAKHITVITKKYGCDTAFRWESSGADGYTIEECDRENLGTEIILELKDNTDDERSLKPMNNTVVKYYFGSILVCSVIIMLALLTQGGYDSVGRAAMDASFTVVSYMSTAGFAICDNSMWPWVAGVVLLFVSFQCGCSGSTTGGIKVDRILIAFKAIGHEIRHRLHPSEISHVRMSGHHLSDGSVKAVMMYIVTYFLLTFASILIVMLYGETATEESDDRDEAEARKKGK